VVGSSESVDSPFLSKHERETHSLQRWNESELYKEDVCIPISLKSYPSVLFKYPTSEDDITTLGHSGSNACNSLQKERDVAIATSVKQEAHIL